MSTHVSDLLQMRMPAMGLAAASGIPPAGDGHGSGRAPARDPREQRITELEARVAELDAYADSVAHELRAPLRAVIGFARILNEDHGREMTDGIRSYVARMVRAVQNMERVVEDLLALSRAGAQKTAPARVRTRELLDQVLIDLAGDMGDRVRVTIGELHDCQGIPGLVRQVWSNLLSNAIKFSRQRDPALIEIGSTVNGGEVTYSVRDNGAGFDMQYAAELFLPFRRFHDARDFEGHGIGLALVQRIVARHGGRAWAVGQPGAGAIVYFVLPAA